MCRYGACSCERSNFQKSVLPAEQVGPKVARRREQWKSVRRSLIWLALRSSMKPRIRPKWRRCGVGRPKASSFMQSALWPLEHHDLHRRAALRPIEALFVFDRPIKKVEAQLCPTLRPGDSHLDGLSSHKNLLSERQSEHLRFLHRTAPTLIRPSRSLPS
jgi:hypothetical protein